MKPKKSTVPDFSSMNLGELTAPALKKLLPDLSSSDLLDYWAARGTQRLKGRTVCHVEYTDAFGMGPCGASIVFTDGSSLVLQAADEGNGPGAGALTNRDGEFVDLLCTIR